LVLDNVIDETRVTPHWLRKREEWIKNGSPAGVITSTAQPVLLPMFACKWREAFLKPEYLQIDNLLPQILKERPIIRAIREAILGR